MVKKVREAVMKQNCIEKQVGTTFKDAIDQILHSSSPEKKVFEYSPVMSNDRGATAII